MARAMDATDGLQWGMVERALAARDKAALIAYLFLVTAAFGFLQPFVPLYFLSAGLSYDRIGWVLGPGFGAALLVQPILGRLSDRLDTRRPFIVAMGLVAMAAFMFFPRLNTIGGFFAAFAVGNAGVMYLNTVGGVLIGRLVRSTRGGTVYAGYRVWGSVGFVMVTLVSGWLLNSAHVGEQRAALDRAFTVAPLMFLAIALVGLFVPDFRNDRPRDLKPPRAPLPTNLKWFLASNFLYVFALYGVTNFLAIAMTVLGGTALWVTGMFAGGVVCEIAVMRFSGRLSDRYGRRPLLALTFCLLPVRLLLYVAVTSPLGLLLVQLLHGLNFGIMGAIAVALINDVSTDATRGQAQARLAVCTGLATATGPVVFGLVSNAYGLRAMFAVAAGVAMVGAALFLLRVRETNDEAESLAGDHEGPLKPLLQLLDSPPTRRG